MLKITLALAAVSSLGLTACVDSDLKCGLGGAAAGAIVSDATGGSAATGAVVGGMAGVLVNDRTNICR